jgi:hypothetical protein
MAKVKQIKNVKPYGNHFLVDLIYDDDTIISRHLLRKVDLIEHQLILKLHNGQLITEEELRDYGQLQYEEGYDEGVDSVEGEN